MGVLLFCVFLLYLCSLNKFTMIAFENSKPLSKIIYLFVFSLAGLFLAGSLVTIVNGFWQDELVLSPWGLRISSGLQMGFMFFMPAITLVTWSGYKPVSYLALNRSSNSFVLYPIAFAILLFGMPFITLLSQVNQLLILPDWLSGVELWMQNLEKSAQETTSLLLNGSSVWDYLGNILFVGVFAAVSEEVFFRGVLQQLLLKVFKNRHVGVWMGAFIFSLMHFQFYGFMPRIVLGAVLGYLFLYSKNLWVPIFVHFMNNALVVTFNFFFRENYVYQYLEDPPLTSSFMAAGLISLGLLIYLFWIFKAKAYNQIER